MQAGEFYLGLYAENACADYTVDATVRTVKDCNRGNETTYKRDGSKGNVLKLGYYMYGSAAAFEYDYYYIPLTIGHDMDANLLLELSLRDEVV